jgi:hypothetical protein
LSAFKFVIFYLQELLSAFMFVIFYSQEILSSFMFVIFYLQDLLSAFKFVIFYLQELLSAFKFVIFYLQELLSAFKMIELRWRSRKCIQMILSNACIINIVLMGHSGDIEKLLIDKSLVGKLSAEMISDGEYPHDF